MELGEKGITIEKYDIKTWIQQGFSMYAKILDERLMRNRVFTCYQSIKRKKKSWHH